MTSRVRLLSAVALLAVASGRLAAQNIPVDVLVPGNSGPSASDLNAWQAMVMTPYGSLPPMITRGMAGGAPGPRENSAFELRYGQFTIAGDNRPVRTGGIGARFGALGLVVGYQGCSGCDGGLLLGADYEGVLVRQMLTGNGAHSLFTLGLRPAVGFGRSFGSGPDVSAISATLDVPVSVAVPVGQTARVVPFVAPGFGVGALRGGGGASDSGTRGSIAFGAALVDLAPGLGLNLGWRKVFIDGGPTTIGVGLTFDR